MKNTLSAAACGSNQYGQSTKTLDISIPIEFIVPSIKNIKAGGWHSLASCSKGFYSFWGCNLDQQIPKSTANLLRSPSSHNISTEYADVAIGSKHTIVLTKKGALQTFGSNNNLQLPSNSISEIKSIYAKFEGTAIITNSDHILFWGNNNHQISINLPNNEIPNFIEITPFGCAVISNLNNLYIFKGNNISSNYKDVVSVASTRSSIIYLDILGRIYEIINNESILIPGIPELPIKLFGGGAHFGCITIKGNCYTWGCGTRGQLGNGYFTNKINPQKVIIDEKKKVIDASAGEEHTLFLLCKDDLFIPNIPKLMLTETLPKTESLLSIFNSTFSPPEFDLKF